MAASSAAAARICLDLVDGDSVGSGDVDGLGAIVLEGDEELDDLALLEGAEAVRLDGGVVDEEVVAAFVGANEAVALVVVEPPHFASRSHALFRH